MNLQAFSVSEFMSHQKATLLEKDNLVFDKLLFIVVVLLVAIGVIMVTSSSMYYAENTFNGKTFYFVHRHLIYLIISISLAAIVLTQPIILWQKYGPYLLIVGILSLVAVLFVGNEVNGSVRVIRIGPIAIQVSEAVKLFVVIYLAGYLVRRTDEIQNQLAGFAKPLLVLAVISVLLLLEPDFGSTAVILSTSMAMLFLGGAKLWQFIGLAFSVGSSLIGIALLLPHARKRIFSFLEPWEDPFGHSYQLVQSLIAFGRGEVFGQGLGNSLQKLSYLPEAHTDFTFAILAEEQGLVGVFIVLTLFFILFYRSMKIGRTALKQQRAYSAYLAYGIGFWLAFQALINIGVTSGALPTKGLTLPFISYGGNSLVICSIAVALLLRIDFENTLVSKKILVAEKTEVKYLPSATKKTASKKQAKNKKRKS